MTAAAWAVTLLALAGCGIYAAATLPAGHHAGRRRLGCVRRSTLNRVTRAAYVTAIWAAAAARRARAERGPT